MIPFDSMEELTKQYIDNNKFYEALKEHKAKVKASLENNKPPPKISNYIGQCISDIANNMIRMQRSDKTGPAFLGYSFTSEMVMDGIENSIQYLHNFDPDKSKNPFAYFSKIIYYAFLRRIAKEKKQLYIKYKSAINHGIFDAITSPDSSSEISSFEVFDNLVDYVEEYEKKQNIKKAKAEKKPKPKKNLESILEE